MKLILLLILILSTIGYISSYSPTVVYPNINPNPNPIPPNLNNIHSAHQNHKPHIHHQPNNNNHQQHVNHNHHVHQQNQNKPHSHPHVNHHPHPHIHQNPHPHAHQNPHPHVHQNPHPHFHQNPHPHVHSNNPHQNVQQHQQNKNINNHNNHPHVHNNNNHHHTTHQPINHKPNIHNNVQQQKQLLNNNNINNKLHQTVPIPNIKLTPEQTNEIKIKQQIELLKYQLDKQKKENEIKTNENDRLNELKETLTKDEQDKEKELYETKQRLIKQESFFKASNNKNEHLLNSLNDIPLCDRVQCNKDNQLCIENNSISYQCVTIQNGCLDCSTLSCGDNKRCKLKENSHFIAGDFERDCKNNESCCRYKPMCI